MLGNGTYLCIKESQLGWVMKHLGRFINVLSYLAELHPIAKVFVFLYSTAFSWVCYLIIISLLFTGQEYQTELIVSLATIFAISIAVHEVGHFVGFRMAGLKSHIIILVIGGITKLDLDEEAKMNHVSTPQIIFAILAGVLSNLLLIAVGWLLYYFGFLSQGTALTITLLNGWLAFTNLLPIFSSYLMTDGAHCINIILESIPSERKTNAYAIQIVLPIIFTMIALMEWIKPVPGIAELLYLSIAIFTFGTIGLAKINAQPKTSTPRLSNKQLRIWSGLYAGITCISFVISVVFLL